MNRFPLKQRLKHRLIKSRWDRWLFPALCTVPYMASLIWLLKRGQVWVVQIMLTPILMGAVLVGITWLLAHAEFRMSTSISVESFSKVIRKWMRSLLNPGP